MALKRFASASEGRDDREQVPVSIVVPCYNCAPYIEACIDSLLAQDSMPLEIICVNDGSTDETPAILKRYAETCSVVKVICKQNGGAWMARLAGIDAARGTYIGFVDGDDTVDKRYLSSLYYCAIENDADITVCGFYRRNEEDGSILSEEFTNERAPFLIGEQPGELISVNPAPWNKLFRAELIKNLPSIPSRPVMFDDLVLLLLAAAISKRFVAFVPQALINYYVHKGSLINNVSQSQLTDAEQVLKDVRAVYMNMALPDDYLDMLSVVAFIHFGVSLQFRLDGNAEAVTKSVGDAEKYLDTTFPEWRTSSYFNLSDSLSSRGVRLKALAAFYAYKLGVFAPMIRFYRWIIRKCGSTIRW